MTANNIEMRPDWDTYFSGIAEAVSKRADCTRGQYGAVIVDTNNRIVSTGYNGSEPGGPSCLKGECPRGQLTHTQQAGHRQGNQDFSNCISLHAEQNAIAYGDWERMNGGTLYVNGICCDMCAKLIKAAGIVRVVGK